LNKSFQTLDIILCNDGENAI